MTYEYYQSICSGCFNDDFYEIADAENEEDARQCAFNLHMKMHPHCTTKYEHFKIYNVGLGNIFERSAEKYLNHYDVSRKEEETYDEYPVRRLWSTRIMDCLATIIRNLRSSVVGG